MAPRQPEAHTFVAPTRPDSVREHHDALTNTVGEMQEFFGISESLSPCAVIVSLQEKTAFTVALEEKFSVYRLLKLIKTQIEPMIARISEKEAELAAAKQARRDHRSEHDWGVLPRNAETVQREWAAYRTRMADELLGAETPRQREGSAARADQSRRRSARPLPREDPERRLRAGRRSPARRR